MKKFIRTVSILALSIAALLGYSLLEARWIQVCRYEIASPDVPRQFHGCRLVFVSDIHHGPYFSLERVDSLVERINRLRPDIVLLGGDFVHRGKEHIAPCFEALARIRAGEGVYAILGNHDHWESTRLSGSSMKRAGIVNLDNGGIWIRRGGGRIRIGGVGDYREGLQDEGPAVAGAGAKDFVILLMHNPDYVEQLESGAVDLVMAGHTHGGQVTLFGLWAPLLPSGHGQKYRGGLLNVRGMRILVTRGIGTITPPVRFFARPEISVVTLKNVKRI